MSRDGNSTKIYDTVNDASGCFVGFTTFLYNVWPTNMWQMIALTYVSLFEPKWGMPMELFYCVSVR